MAPPQPPEWVIWAAMLVVGMPILTGYGVLVWLVIREISERFFD